MLCSAAACVMVAMIFTLLYLSCVRMGARGWHEVLPALVTPRVTSRGPVRGSVETNTQRVRSSWNRFRSNALAEYRLVGDSTRNFELCQDELEDDGCEETP